MTPVGEVSLEDKTGINLQIASTVENLLLCVFIHLQAKTAFRQGSSPEIRVSELGIH